MCKYYFDALHIFCKIIIVFDLDYMMSLDIHAVAAWAVVMSTQDVQYFVVVKWETIMKQQIMLQGLHL